MPDVLSELVVKITADAAELKKGLSDAEKDITHLSDKARTDLKTMGIAFVAFGATITAALGFATKAAIDEEVNINRLSIALQNVGVNYDDVKESLEAVIEATQRKTGIADNEQRDALSELLLITGNYNTALKWLPLTLDLAAAKQMDFSSAATLMGRAAVGNTALLSRYGIVIKEGASSAEIFARIQERVAGAAEATASPLNILKATMGDLAELVGSALVPVLTWLLENAIMPLISAVQDLIEEHPLLAKVIIISTGVVGGLAIAIGTLAFAIGSTLIPKIIAGIVVMWHWVAAQLAAIAASGIGIPIAIAAAAAIGILTTGVVLLAQNQKAQMEAEMAAAKATENLGAASVDTTTQIAGLTKAQNDLTKATAQANIKVEKQISLFQELMGLAGKKYPKGLTEAETKVWGEMLWAAKRGITEVGGYAPGTVGFMRALGYTEFQQGGIVSGAIGQPQLAMVHGGETIIPANEGLGNVIINFTQPVFFDREDSMNTFVDKISKSLDRKYRLRFGGAYSG